MLDSIDFGGVLTDALRGLALAVPKLVAFAVILALGSVLAVAMQKMCAVVLDRTGFDRAVERGGIRQLLARSDYDASDLIAKIVFYGVMLLTLQMACGVWGPNPVSDLINRVVTWLPNAVVAVVLVVVAAAAARAVRRIVTAALAGHPFAGAAATAASASLLCLGVVAGLNQIGVALSVTLPVLITVLATIGGILVVGAGGGLIKPMQQRWERWLGAAEGGMGTGTGTHSAAPEEHPADYDSAYAAGRAAGDTYQSPLTGWPTLDDTAALPFATADSPQAAASPWATPASTERPER